MTLSRTLLALMLLQVILALNCNYSEPHDDPEQVQVAQLRAIECLILSNERSHAETLKTIRSISYSSTPTIFVYFIHFTISCLIYVLIRQICCVVFYLCVQRFDICALGCLWYCRIVRGQSLSSYHEVRDKQKVPCLLYMFRCIQCPDTASINTPPLESVDIA